MVSFSKGCALYGTLFTSFVGVLNAATTGVGGLDTTTSFSAYGTMMAIGVTHQLRQHSNPLDMLV